MSGTVLTPVDYDTRSTVEDLYARYVKCLDAADFAAWPDFFIDDCTYKVQARENHDRGLPLAVIALESRAMLKDRVFGITTTLYHQPYYQRHIVSSFLIEPRSDESIAVEANYAVFRTKQNHLTEVFNTGRYYDVLVRDGGALKFRDKLCVYDSELIPNSLIYPV
jgi:salicylate 5-hydroxylase small subunit